ncbi:hypothetical protein QE152_g38474 [Popillia japonica]|uniref:Uncharacterized protein n=1 Tax=Popillia japonica TaxID=7064 RepID=A0AAW1HXH3_POPJA
MTDELIRDKLVVAIREIKLSERMQMDSKLTLTDAKTLIVQNERVKQENKNLKREFYKGGHYAKMCKTKNKYGSRKARKIVNAVQESSEETESTEDEIREVILELRETGNTPWVINLETDDNIIEYNIDTEADV